MLASALTLILVLVAFASPQYRQLSKAYADAPPPEPQPGDDEAAVGESVEPATDDDARFRDETRA